MIDTTMRESSVAYFSMEVGLDPAMPTYSGGLGVLAGDTLRAAADLSIPMVGVTLVHRKGYFRQRLSREGRQTARAATWSPEQVLEPLPPRVTVVIEGRPVQVCAWRYAVRGVSGHTVPVYLLDTHLPENDPADQALTDHLYGGDQRYRLAQEIVLGLGGVAMLRALGHERVGPYHMNEGHSAFLTVALLEEQMGERGPRAMTEADQKAVRGQCVFTTHTPVPAGHDQFPIEMAERVLGADRVAALATAGCCPDGMLNMTRVALAFSRYVNGVSMRHEEVSQGMFPDHPIDAITNGVHAATWTSPHMARLFDRRIPEWRHDNLYLRYAGNVPLEEIRAAHARAKQDLLAEVARRTGRGLDPNVLTLGFARRATAYKRADLLFSDLQRLRGIAGRVGPLQVIYGGKAHPRDDRGKALIRRIFEFADTLGDELPVVYLEEYGMALGALLTAGVDVWLNTPQKPLEASGTSGMKAALNGVPSLSVLDGWWVEGHVEGVTGWEFGEDAGPAAGPSAESDSLYDKLERVIMPLYYQRPNAFAQVMRSAVAINGSFFNAQRMAFQYLTNAYQVFG